MANNKSIQFLRGTSSRKTSVGASTTLLAGQPFYETDTNRLYVGQNKSLSTTDYLFKNDFDSKVNKSGDTMTGPLTVGGQVSATGFKATSGSTFNFSPSSGNSWSLDSTYPSSGKTYDLNKFLTNPPYVHYLTMYIRNDSGQRYAEAAAVLVTNSSESISSVSDLYDATKGFDIPASGVWVSRGGVASIVCLDCRDSNNLVAYGVGLSNAASTSPFTEVYESIWNSTSSTAGRTLSLSDTVRVAAT